MPIYVLPNQIRAHRKLRGFSQKEVAFLLGCRSGAMVANYEGNRRVPNLDHALELAALLELTVDEIFAGRAMKAMRRVEARSQRLLTKLEKVPLEEGVKRKVRTLAAIIENAKKAG